jgi:peroxiredoxin/predicted 2-oxoglutarate/Fe(II)-dependent dioxygenase YbiX
MMEYKHVQSPTQSRGDGKAQAPRRGPSSPFDVSDLLPDIVLPDENNALAHMSKEMIGRKLLLLLCPDPTLSACAAQLAGYAELFGDLDPLVHIYGITTSPPDKNHAALAGTSLPFPLLSDVDRQVAGGLGIGHNLSPPMDGEGRGAFTVILADENRRILHIERDITAPGHAGLLLDHLRALPPREARTLGGFAPVLYVPKVLDPSFCQELMAAFEAGNPEMGGIYRSAGAGEKGRHLVDTAVKSRRDLYIDDPGLLEEIQYCFVRRLQPEISKAFTREVTGVDFFKVVCYDAANGGHFHVHRDNIAEHTAHRRFAATINLNTGEFEGGALRFPEYGPDLYVPGAGDAVIFSCSLMHEVLPVTKGRRFVLLFFMFDEESRQFNDRFQNPDRAKS